MSMTPAKRPRILVFGQTGVEKSIAIDRVMRVYAEANGIPSEGTLRDRHIRYLDVEKEIGRRHSGSLSLFLERSDPRYLIEAWTRAVKKVIEELEHFDGPAFIGLHGLCHWRGRQFSPIVIPVLRELNITDAVCLIDDVYAVWQRVVARAERASDGSYFRLKEIAALRAGELNMADLVTRTVCEEREDTPVRLLSVRQKPEMLHRLLFEKDKLRAYASFPITQTRSDPGRREEIDAFRGAVSSHFTVFDPLCIDEKMLQFIYIEAMYLQQKSPDDIASDLGFDVAYVERFVAAHKERWDPSYRLTDQRGRWQVLLHPQDRWPIDDDECLVGWDAGPVPITGPIALWPGEIKEVSRDVDYQIRDRDFRLIHQSEAVVMYRPQYHGVASEGVLAEAMYAQQSEAIRVFPGSIPDEDGEPKGPFGRFQNPIKEKTPQLLREHLVRVMQGVEAEQQRNAGGGNR